jgi:DNA-directed RNA polymerase subunit H (RpoH/RPB5)
MTNAQKERLIRSMRLQNKTLPKIRIDDPVISAMIEDGQEISLGDMIEIERDSLTFGKSLYYREVIQ